ncbi:30S ribosomal protein S15 [Microgenomates group bacterium RIFCSPLOWO2_01_FULL_47_10]|nr:MAG: 30S ribosomal protein S15 [Microgenomates group bacterium RIFCSPLOWO2_01_FULL_47_10]
MLTIDKKKTIMTQYATKKGDTGSPEVQVALITTRVAELADHLKAHVKDNHSRRGLLKMMSKRRRLLNYLMKKDEVRYKNLLKKLGLKK